MFGDGNFYDANVSGLNTSLNSKNNDYFIEANAVIILMINNILGHTLGFRTGKQRGNFTFGIGYYEESDTYDPE